MSVKSIDPFTEKASGSSPSNPVNQQSSSLSPPDLLDKLPSYPARLPSLNQQNRNIYVISQQKSRSPVLFEPPPYLAPKPPSPYKTSIPGTIFAMNAENEFCLNSPEETCLYQGNQGESNASEGQGQTQKDPYLIQDPYLKCYIKDPYSK